MRIAYCVLHHVGRGRYAIRNTQYAILLSQHHGRPAGAARPPAAFAQAGAVLGGEAVGDRRPQWPAFTELGLDAGERLRRDMLPHLLHQALERGGPLRAGRTETFGAFGAGAGATTPVALLVAEAEPALLDAVTVTRMARPTSPGPNVYSRVVAPAMEAQFAPAASHRFHWYAYPVGELDHVPADAARVTPCCGVPLIVGSAVFAGGSDVGGEVHRR